MVIFSQTDVENRETKMIVRITTKGVKETLEAGKTFQSLPKKLKENKIATLGYLKQIIENANLIIDDVENFHDKNGYMFAYFGCNVLIDEEKYYVRISVKKKYHQIFSGYIILTKEKVLNYSTHPKDRIKRDSEL